MEWKALQTAKSHVTGQNSEYSTKYCWQHCRIGNIQIGMREEKDEVAESRGL